MPTDDLVVRGGSEWFENQGGGGSAGLYKPNHLHTTSGGEVVRESTLDRLMDERLQRARQRKADLAAVRAALARSRDAGLTIRHRTKLNRTKETP